MKKQLLFWLATAPLMAVAAGLRLWQRSTAFEPDTGLLTPGMPATWCLTGFLLLAAAGLGWLSWKMTRTRSFRSYLDGFFCAVKPARGAYVLAGAVMVAAGVLGLWERQTGLEPQLSRLILSVGLLPAGVSVGLVGWLNGESREGRGRFAWPLLLPGYCGCLWLICGYQLHTGNPNEMEYLFYFLGMVCAVVCCYLMAAFSFEKPTAFPCLWTGSAALVLLATAAVDQALTGSRMALLVTLGYGLYVAAQVTILAARCGAPAQLEPWTADEKGEDVENEVTDHE